MHLLDLINEEKCNQIRKVTGMDEATIESLIKNIARMPQSRVTKMADDIASKIAEFVHPYQAR